MSGPFLHVPTRCALKTQILGKKLEGPPEHLQSIGSPQLAGELELRHGPRKELPYPMV